METALSRPKPVEGRLPFSYNKIKQRNQKTKKIKKKKGGGGEGDEETKQKDIGLK